jgi:hypothetical protein
VPKSRFLIQSRPAEAAGATEVTQGQHPLRRIIASLGGFARQIDRRVRKIHANWLTIWAVVLGTVGALAIALHTAPRERGSSPVFPRPSRAGDVGPAGGGGEAGRELPPPIFASEGGASTRSRPCDAAYAAAKKRTFLDLIEADARRRFGKVGSLGTPAYSCRVAEGVYELTLHTVVQAPGGEPRPFSAQYRGVGEIDPGQVNVAPLKP